MSSRTKRSQRRPRCDAEALAKACTERRRGPAPAAVGPGPSRAKLWWMSFMVVVAPLGGFPEGLSLATQLCVRPGRGGDTWGVALSRPFDVGAGLRGFLGTRRFPGQSPSSPTGRDALRVCPFPWHRTPYERRQTCWIHVTWWGHATVMVEDRVRCLTDPLLHSRLLHIQRPKRDHPVTAPIVDAVLISRLHADHLRLPSLRRIDPGTVVLVPRGSARLLRSLPLDVVEVSAGDGGSARRRPRRGGPRHAQRPSLALEQIPWATRSDTWSWGRGATLLAGDAVGFPGMAACTRDRTLPCCRWAARGPWLRQQRLDPPAAAECLPQLRCRVAV